YVQKGIYKAFVDRFVAAVGKLSLGPGYDESMDVAVDVGPVINQAGLDSALEQIADAVKKGARVVAGGERWKDSPGFFLRPTVLENVCEDAVGTSEEKCA